MAPRTLPRDLADTARDQHGVLGRWQLRAAGISDAVVRRRCADGSWIERDRAIVIPAWMDDSDDHRAWLLQAHTGFDAIVSGPVAARLAGWDIPGTERIVVRSSYTTRLPTDVTVLRREVPAAPVERGLLRLATRLDALADTLITRPWGSACDLLEHALQQGWVDQSIVDALIARRSGRGRTGVGRLRRLRAYVTGDHRSEAERRMREILARSGTGAWEANYLLQRRGRVVAELDFAHLSARIAIEIDGRAYHSSAEAFENDRARQNRLSVEGWLVLRFTWKQITTDPASVIATIRHALRLRTHEAS